jgi:hypothetical protein
MRTNTVLGALAMGGALVVMGCSEVSEISQPELKEPIEKETRTVDAFSKVRAGGAFEIDVTQGDSPHLEIEAQPTLIKNITTEVQDGELVIKLNGRFNTKEPMKIHLRTDELETIALSGASRVTSDETWSGEDFTLHADGASRADLRLKVDRLHAELSGASNLDLKGEAKEADFSLSGACHLGGENLTLATAKVNASGASRLDLNVTEAIAGDVSGASRLTYQGKPTVDVNRSGASSVSEG